MPRKAREQSATGIYHVMLRGINRQDIFEEPEDYWHFIRALSILPDRLMDDLQTHQCCCHIYAYCLMPNHVHILLREKEWTIGQCVKLLADTYVRYYNKKYGRSGHLFQDRFKSEPCNDIEYFVTLLRYIHQNPLKAGLAESVRDYDYSSWGNDYLHLGSIQCCNTQTVLKRIPFQELEALVNESLPKVACLDMDERQIISDAEIREWFINKRCLRSISDFMLLSLDKRKETIREAFHQFDVTPFQISRITGMNYETIRKISKEDRQ